MTEQRTEDYREQIRELVEQDGISEEDARLRPRDTDLWLLHAGARFDEDLTGEEGVRLWEEAAMVARTVAAAVSNGPGTIQASPAVTMLAWDAASRAEEALRRARQRAWPVPIWGLTGPGYPSGCPGPPFYLFPKKILNLAHMGDAPSPVLP